jgi:aminoglycoside phosphotransferase family enzyme/predicted kinase
LHLRVRALKHHPCDIFDKVKMALSHTFGSRDAVAGFAGTSTEEQERLIRALTDPTLYGVACTHVRVIETHISYVLLTGRDAYKIKKAVTLGFLDFSTLAARHFYCDRELELNRRFAPLIYLDVVAITGTVDAPRIGGDGPAIEYAVKMLEFPQSSLLTRMLARAELSAVHVDRLAEVVAAFHASAATADVDSQFGSGNEVLELAIENFTEISPLLEDESDRRELAALRRWTEQDHALHAVTFAERQRRGFIRECHGDLHLGNIALVEGKVTLFDCIEFNDRMRWGDVMADVAFLLMDLQDRGRSDFAWRLLNDYLELTGDYDGVQILRFYVVYRAMVRAKVACFRATQATDTAARTACINEYRDSVRLATRCSESTTRGIVMTRGPTGSGKTIRSQAFVELVGAVRIRTDVERKRLHGLTPLSPSGSALNAGLYAAAETDRTYSKVASLARTVAAAGYLVIADGTFLQRGQRDQLRAVAADLDVPFVMVDFVASVDTLRTRVQVRHQTRLDASEADTRVLEHQLRVADPLAADERVAAISYDAEAPLEQSRQLESWQPVLDRLHAQAAATR